MDENLQPINSDEDTIIPTAVAIDRDKNSQFAVKWAVDNLNLKNNRIILVHVINAQPNLHTQDAVPKEGGMPTQSELQQLFLPYRGFCARKGIRVTDVVLHDPDIANALSEYVKAKSITTIVLGASNRNALSRAFRNADVPICVGKSVPDSCSVYVVSKGGKALKIKSSDEPSTFPEFHRQGSWRTATELSSLEGGHQQRSMESSRNTSPVNSSDISQEYQQSGTWIRPFSIKTSSPRNALSTYELLHMAPWERPYNSKNPTPVDSENSSFDSPPIGSNNNSPQDSYVGSSSEFMYTTPQNRQVGGSKVPILRHNLQISTKQNFRRSTSDSSDQSREHSFHSDVSFEFLDHHSQFSESSRSSTSTVTVEMEDELRRLKLELTQLTEKYNAACKEVVTAREKVREIDQWKLEEARKSDETKIVQESALAIVAREKQKCKAAVIVATRAQRIAELESEKRRHAELKFKYESDERQKAMEALTRNVIRYRKYSVDEIEVATNHFSTSDKIGEGGYGPVYKAFLDHTPVAIKILRPDLSQGQKQFQREVEVLSRMRHPHMVILLGACPEYGCLVYEYMENGSLEDRLYRKNGTPSLSWRDRFRIAAEVAIALNFLHQTRPEPLVHRDLKPANILLNKNYVSKISDVGLARLVPPSLADSITQYHMTSAAGTFCYIDPEYQQTGMLGTKSDVYSLGILLLQIITAKPPMGLTYQVESAIATGNFTKILDPTVDNWPVEEALSFAKLALKCCELRRRDRPELDSVILPELERLRELGSETKGRYSYMDSQTPSFQERSDSIHDSQNRFSYMNSQGQSFLERSSSS